MSLPISETLFAVCTMSKKLLKAAVTLQIGPFFPWLQTSGDLGFPLSKMLAATEEVGDRQFCLCMPLLKGQAGGSLKLSPYSHEDIIPSSFIPES